MDGLRVPNLTAEVLTYALAPDKHTPLYKFNQLSSDLLMFLYTE